MTERTDNDYYARFSYKAIKGELKPVKVPVYCMITSPTTPTCSWSSAKSCEDWYHPQCVGTTKNI